MEITAEDIANFFSMGWVDVLAALLTPTIAIIAVYIAFQQFKVNKDSFREKLFDRRFEVFKGTQKFLSIILRDATFTDDDLFQFSNAKQRARFLFGKELDSYLDKIYNEALRMRSLDRRIKGSLTTLERDAVLDEHESKSNWLTDQLPVIFDKFHPYLGFGTNK